ncbi:hypothetical protein J1N35_001504 [Gossypium stocksii]|uniref:Uncharacterized protein n=1 Tax=Gossypium stocksii TaxID=47602 RepID=A0A9D4ALD2_9ROSI|nr:hypothetical protein J1N35_001504 [Gossypium stocksii]
MGRVNARGSDLAPVPSLVRHYIRRPESLKETFSSRFHSLSPDSRVQRPARGLMWRRRPCGSSDARGPLGSQLRKGSRTNIMCSTSTCGENGEKFDDEEVKIFLQECDGNTKRQVRYSDFYRLQEELNKVKHNCFPSFLDPIIQKIKHTYGDITEKSKLISCAAHPTLVMFYTMIKEMNEVKVVKDFGISKLKVWRDAICDALQINMEVEFAK